MRFSKASPRSVSGVVLCFGPFGLIHGESRPTRKVFAASVGDRGLVYFKSRFMGRTTFGAAFPIEADDTDFETRR